MSAKETLFWDCQLSTPTTNSSYLTFYDQINDHMRDMEAVEITREMQEEPVYSAKAPFICEEYKPTFKQLTYKISAEYEWLKLVHEQLIKSIIAYKNQNPNLNVFLSISPEKILDDINEYVQLYDLIFISAAKIREIFPEEQSEIDRFITKLIGIRLRDFTALIDLASTTNSMDIFNRLHNSYEQFHNNVYAAAPSFSS